MTKTPLTTETVNPMDEKLSALRDLFPEAFREDKLDTNLFSATLWDRISTEKEGYGMTWAGKTDARKQILTPTSHTLAGDEKASVKWNATQNIFIEWDNLTVLKLLQKSYTKQVKMVYIDPPYNTGKDFIYNDNFHADKTEYEESTGQRTAEGIKMVANTETNGRYHSDWLSMMYPRLHLARNLLREDGVIFVSIDDHEVHNLRKVMDEVFGEENFIACITVVGNPRWRDYGGVARMHDYILVYTRTIESEINDLNEPNKEFPFEDERWGFEIRELRNRNIAFHIGNRPNLYYPFYVNTKKQDKDGFFEISLEEKTGWFEVVPKESQGYKTVWRWGKPKSQENLNTEIVAKEMEDGGFQIVEKYRKKTKMARSVWWDKEDNTEKGTLEVKNLFQKKVFDFPKSMWMVRKMIEMGSNGKDIILDFFAGSGTTGHAVMSLNAEEKTEAVKNGINPDEVGNRRYICVQIPELTDEKKEAFKAGYKKISDITAERLRRAGNKIAEENKDLTLDTGFRLYRLADSCYKVANVNYDSDNEQFTLESFEKALKDGLSPLRDGVTEDDIITENLIKEGFPLNIALSKEKIGKTAFIHAETEGKRLFISFDDSIPLETIDEVQKGYKAAIFVVYDSALTDPLKVMLASRVTLRTI